jgi:hypothetical protein
MNSGREWIAAAAVTEQYAQLGQRATSVIGIAWRIAS